MGVAAPLSMAAAASTGGASRIRRNVVETAVAVMGSPFRWGGTDENGFDCSGLIQYAYGEHGVILPRRSRDQARTGVNIERDLALLQATAEMLLLTVYSAPNRGR